MNKKIQKAFTLIELLVVIAIIGILSGLIITTMSGATESARIAKLKVYSNSVRDTLGANLVSEWKFDGLTIDGNPAIANDVLNSWGGLSNGTIPAPPAIPTVKAGSNCINGSCLSFDGGDYIDCGSGANLNVAAGNAYTIEMWVSIDSAATRYLIDKQGIYTGYYIYLDSNRKLNFGYPNGSVWNELQTTTSLILNRWTHIAGTHNGTKQTIYIDGVSDKTRDLTVNLVNSTTNLYIGSRIGGGYYYSGLMDNFRLYNAAISATQVQENYLAGLSKLLANNGITKQEYDNRISKLSSNVSKE